MKVVYTHQVCLNYKATFLTRLQRDHAHQVFGLFGQSHWKQSKFRSVKDIPEIDYRCLPTFDIYFPFRKRYAHFFWNPTLIRNLKEIQPDVIITGLSNFPNNSAIMKYCKRDGVPYVWHGLGSMYKKDSIARKLINGKIRRFTGDAAGGLAYNTDSKNYYVEKYGVDPEEIAIATNVVDTEKVAIDRVKFAPQVLALKRKLDLDQGKVILFVGAIDPVKKLDVLLDAFSKVKKNDQHSTKLLVVGDGMLAADMKTLSRRLGVEKDVVFVGKKIDDVNLYYMLGDIFVMPGLGGLAISHAMAHGLAVITAPADGTEKDLIQSGETGILLKQTDGPNEIADHLRHLLSDEATTNSIAQRARETIETRFSIGNTVAIMDQMIQRVTQST